MSFSRLFRKGIIVFNTACSLTASILTLFPGIFGNEEYENTVRDLAIFQVVLNSEALITNLLIGISRHNDKVQNRNQAIVAAGQILLPPIAFLISRRPDDYSPQGFCLMSTAMQFLGGTSAFYNDYSLEVKKENFRRHRASVFLKVDQEDIDLLEIIIANLKILKRYTYSRAAEQLLSYLQMGDAEKLKAYIYKILNSGLRNQHQFAENVYALSLLITKYWPNNAKNEHGQYICPFSYEPIPKKTRLLLAVRGYQIDAAFAAPSEGENDLLPFYTYIKQRRSSNEFPLPFVNYERETTYLDERAEAIRNNIENSEIPHVVNLIPPSQPQQSPFAQLGGRIGKWLGLPGTIGTFIYGNIWLIHGIKDDSKDLELCLNYLFILGITLGVGSLSTVIGYGLGSLGGNCIGAIYNCSQDFLLLPCDQMALEFLKPSLLNLPVEDEKPHPADEKTNPAEEKSQFFLEEPRTPDSDLKETLLERQRFYLLSPPSTIQTSVSDAKIVIPREETPPEHNRTARNP